MINSAILEQYNTIDWQKLLRKDLWEHSLEEVKNHLDKIKFIFDSILNYPNIDSLSVSFTNQIQNQLQSFIWFSNQIINNFKDTTQRQTWLDNIKNKEYEVFQNLSAIYNYIQSFDPNKDWKLKEIEKNYREKIEKLNEDLIKTDELLKSAQKKSVEEEILEYWNFFWTEAQKNTVNAKVNFNLMLLSILITLLLTIFFLQEIEFIQKEWQWFFENLFTTINSQNIIIKFVILSLWWYLISHFSSTYSTEKHLYNLNIQRQNALNSHKQILDSVISTQSENEKEIRNVILLELTRAIFDTKDTWYLKWWNQWQSTSQIIEITKTLTK